MNTTEQENKIIEAMKAKGHRITMPRRIIIRTVLQSKKPLSAAETLEKMQKKDFEVNKTTVYRELQNLAEANFIRSVIFDDGIRRYQAYSDAHTHHIICTECKDVDDVEMNHDLDTVEKSIAKTSKFKVTSHSLEFYGVCKDCQK